MKNKKVGVCERATEIGIKTMYFEFESCPVERFWMLL